MEANATQTDEVYEGAADSAWDRGQEAIRRSRLPKSMPSFPKSLEKLLASKEWKGSTVEVHGRTLEVRHPNGVAVMRLQSDVFERIAQKKAEKDLERRQIEHRREARKANKAQGISMTRHTVGVP